MSSELPDCRVIATIELSSAINAVPNESHATKSASEIDLQHRGWLRVQNCVVIEVKYDDFPAETGLSLRETRWYFDRWPVHGQLRLRGRRYVQVCRHS
jgi:hypothetical protein